MRVIYLNKVLFTIWVMVRTQGYHSYRHKDESSTSDCKPWYQSNATELMENVEAYAILIIKFAKRRKHSQKPSHRTLQNVSPVSKRSHYGHNLFVSHTSIIHHAINVGGYNDFVTAGTA